MQGKIETRVGIFVLVAIGIFVYMGFQIGAFRFDRSCYAPYTMFFKDISGLSRKAEVKIAGVKVGWVEEIKLIPDDRLQAEAVVMVLKEFKLYEDAHAIIRQDGLLGPKYLELVPGSPLLSTLPEGAVLGKPNIAPVDIDELLHTFKKIANNVESVSTSLRNTLGGAQGEQQLESIFENFNNAAEKLSAFSDILERSFERNEEKLDSFLEIGETIRRLADKLEGDVFPAFQEGVNKISDTFERDFSRVADKLSSTADAFEEASLQARDSFSHVTSITEKIDEGKGLIGKLINEDETYRDLKVTVEGLKNYFAEVNALQIVFDGHGETMYRPAENYRWEDAKFYFDMRAYPNEDNFYLAQLVSSQKGWRDEKEIIQSYSNDDGTVTLDTENLLLRDIDRLNRVYRRKETTLNRNTVKFGLQFGKVYHDIALRFGIFENTGGLGVDFDIPFKTDKLRWVTTLEMFDMVGWNRLPGTNLNDDRRPHFKWLNRMFILRNIYVTFGADDFASRRNASGFAGVGIRFGDNDIKYLLPSLSGASGLSS